MNGQEVGGEGDNSLDTTPTAGKLLEGGETPTVLEGSLRQKYSSRESAGEEAGPGADGAAEAERVLAHPSPTRGRHARVASDDVGLRLFAGESSSATVWDSGAAEAGQAGGPAAAAAGGPGRPPSRAKRPTLHVVVEAGAGEEGLTSPGRRTTPRPSVLEVRVQAGSGLTALAAASCAQGLVMFTAACFARFLDEESCLATSAACMHAPAALKQAPPAASLNPLAPPARFAPLPQENDIDIGLGQFAAGLAGTDFLNPISPAFTSFSMPLVPAVASTPRVLSSSHSVSLSARGPGPRRSPLPPGAPGGGSSGAAVGRGGHRITRSRSAGELGEMLAKMEAAEAEDGPPAPLPGGDTPTRTVRHNQSLPPPRASTPLSRHSAGPGLAAPGPTPLSEPGARALGTLGHVFSDPSFSATAAAAATPLPELAGRTAGVGSAPRLGVLGSGGTRRSWSMMSERDTPAPLSLDTLGSGGAEPGEAPGSTSSTKPPRVNPLSPRCAGRGMAAPARALLFTRGLAGEPHVCGHRVGAAVNSLPACQKLCLGLLLRCLGGVSPSVSLLTRRPNANPSPPAGPSWSRCRPTVRSRPRRTSPRC